MYAEVSFGSHLVEEGEVELPRPIVQTPENEELQKALFCQLEVRKQASTVTIVLVH